MAVTVVTGVAVLAVVAVVVMTVSTDVLGTYHRPGGDGVAVGEYDTSATVTFVLSWPLSTRVIIYRIHFPQNARRAGLSCSRMR